MQTFVTATIVAFFGLATALPTNTLDTRAPGDVTFCTGANYSGDCTAISVPFNQCQKVPAALAGKVGSMKVDAGAYCRITYTAETCTLHGDAFIWPDTNAPDLHNFDDPATDTVVDAGAKMTSFLCQQCTNCNSKA